MKTAKKCNVLKADVHQSRRIAQNPWNIAFAPILCYRMLSESSLYTVRSLLRSLLPVKIAAVNAVLQNLPLYSSQSVYRSCSGKACELCFESLSSFRFRVEYRPWRSKGGVEVSQLFLAAGSRWGVVGAPASLPLTKRPGTHLRMLT